MRIFADSLRKIVIFFAMICTLLILYAICTGYNSCYISSVNSNNCWLLFSLAFVLANVFFGVHKFITAHNFRHPEPFALALLVLIQFLLIFSIYRYSLPWADSLSVINEASRMSAEPFPLLSAGGGYFEMYGNNSFYTILICYYFKFLALFGLKSYWIEMLVLNMFMIDLSVILGYFTVRQNFSGKVCTAYVLLSLINPIYYLFLPFAYSNTMSFPFLAGFLYLSSMAVNSVQTEISCRRSILYGALASFCLVIGYRIRPTMIIAAIAVMIVLLFRPEHHDKACAFKTVAVVVISCAILYLASGIMMSSHIPSSVTEKNFPVTHWIMMGLGGDNGSYSEDDEDFTYQFETKEDKQQANLDQIRERLNSLKESGTYGVLSFLYEKFRYTWGTVNMDGLFIETGRTQGYSPISRFIYGWENSYVLLYYQAFKILLYFLVLIAVIRQLKCNEWGTESFCILIFTGFILFYMIWEANCRYSLPAFPVIMLLASAGFDHFKEGMATADHKPALILKKFGSSAVLIVLVLLPAMYFMTVDTVHYTAEPFEKESDLVLMAGRSFLEQGIDTVASKKTVITQTFTVDRPFNRIGFYYQPGTGDASAAAAVTADTSSEISSDSDALLNFSYIFELKDEYGNVLYSAPVFPEGQHKKFDIFDIPEVIPDGVQTYTIQISSAGNPDHTDSISFLYFDMPEYDYYEGGSMSVDGMETDRDLIFMVADASQECYTTPHRYLAAKVLVFLIVTFIALIPFADCRKILRK